MTTSLATLSEYWQAIERYTSDRQYRDHKVSSDYQYLKAAFLSYSASMAKPVELVKLGIHQVFKNTRIKLEPVSEVCFKLYRC